MRVALPVVHDVEPVRLSDNWLHADGARQREPGVERLSPGGKDLARSRPQCLLDREPVRDSISSSNAGSTGTSSPSIRVLRRSRSHDKYRRVPNFGTQTPIAGSRAHVSPCEYAPQQSKRADTARPGEEISMARHWANRFHLLGSEPWSLAARR